MESIGYNVWPRKIGANWAILTILFNKKLMMRRFMISKVFFRNVKFPLNISDNFDLTTNAIRCGSYKCQN